VLGFPRECAFSQTQRTDLLLFLLLVLLLPLLLVLAKGKEKGNVKEPRFKVQGTSEKGQGQQPRRFCVTVVAAGKTKPSISGSGPDGGLSLLGSILFG
jgi:hypothetical protein